LEILTSDNTDRREKPQKEGKELRRIPCMGAVFPPGTVACARLENKGKGSK